jgi:hypothetical protein
MQLKSRDGIMCDSCGTSYQHDFTYMSIDLTPIEIVANRYPTSQKQTTHSLDYCPKCMAELCQKVKTHYKATNVGANCDLDGKEMRGDFTFYIGDVTKVIVKFGVNKQKPMVSLDKDYLRLTICEDCYNTAVHRHLQLRRIASEFSASSE